VLEHGVVTATDLAGAIVRLRAAGCVFAEDEAAVLGGVATDAAHLSGLVDRRARGEPLEQVVGFADFCGVRVRLRPGVFVPRVRSELLVRTAATEVRTAPTDALWEREIEERAGGKTVVDLCCGSGALGLAVRHEVPAIRLFAADSDPVAVGCALDNLGRDVFQGDLFAALPEALRGHIDVLLANVPYVATEHIALLPAEARLHEPRSALDGGADGLDVFRAVVAGAAAWLAPGGLLLSEITAAQAEAAVAAARDAGLRAGIVEDEDLEARAVTARRPKHPRR
jgi:release factor glutamine methyltransferase